MILHRIVNAIKIGHRMFDIFVRTFVMHMMDRGTGISVVLNVSVGESVMRVFLFVFHKSS
jgi:hypothetical protein